MANKPHNFEWLGYNGEQIGLLGFIDHLGNNGWARNSQTDEVMTKVLAECSEAHLGIGQVIDAMRSIGYSRDALHMLERWESKRTTEKFGR